MLHKISRRRIVAGLSLAPLAGAMDPVLAQRKGTTRIILPVSVSSAIDLGQRTLLPELRKALGTNAYVENIPGGSLTIGTGHVVRAAPDGSTIGVTANHHLIAPLVMGKVPYDPIRDITPISILGTAALAIAVHPDFPAKNVPDLVRLLRDNPGKYNYASAGLALLNEIAMVMLFEQAKVKAQRVIYNGTAPQLTAVLGNECQFGVFGFAGLVPQIESGKLRVIGVCGDSRTKANPAIPTVAEQGFPGYSAEAWHLVFGPARMPAEVVNPIFNAYKTVAAIPAMREQLLAQGTELDPKDPQTSAATLRADYDRYAQLAKAANLKVE